MLAFKNTNSVPCCLRYADGECGLVFPHSKSSLRRRNLERFYFLKKNRHDYTAALKRVDAFWSSPHSSDSVVLTA